jgi:ABC-type transporter Mla subunit MlaD
MTGETFIEILKKARVELLEGLGKDLPVCDGFETREALEQRVSQIETDIVEPLRALINDLTEFVDELNGKCDDVVTAVGSANAASDEFDSANEAREEFGGDDESEEFAELENDVTDAENAMEEADDELSSDRDGLADAIATLVENIGAPEVQA